MTARHLVAALSLTLAAGAAFAAIKQAQGVAPQSPVASCEPTAPAIARVVVTARRADARQAEAPVARVVVTARRIGTRELAAAGAR